MVHNMDLQQKIIDICLRYEIADLYVFGSRSREIAGKCANIPVASKDESDIDIGILPMHIETWNPEKRVDLIIELEDIFMAKRIDLVLLPEADSFLALDIIRGELLYTKNADRQAGYELFILRRAGDLAHFKKVRTGMILEEGCR
jgi:uncharacterized protein